MIPRDETLIHLTNIFVQNIEVINLYLFLNCIPSGRFAGQGVIVTGGAGGIGGMIVHRLSTFYILGV